MAANPRFEISSSSPDSAVYGYQNSHRGHASSGPILERVSSFRETHEGRSAQMQGAAGLGITGVSSSELPPLTQVLSLDLIASGEQKYAQQLELQRATIAAVGVAGDVHGNLQPKPLEQQGLDDLKRIKTSLADNAARARERSRSLAEAMAKLDKYRASWQTRKRARAEAAIHERPVATISMERNCMTGNPGKANFVVSPSNVCADGGTLKSEDKNKPLVPNKRVRTSMVDSRHEGRMNLQRSSGLGDRDSLKNSSPAGLADEKDRVVCTGGEAWEKNKMKGRRSGTKTDNIVSTPANGVLDAEREQKWAAHHRSSVENRSRPSEGHGFRSGPVHGVVSLHKVESAQQAAVPVRCVNKTETEGPLSLGDKGDRGGFITKERLHQKNGVKLTLKEEGTFSNPATATKAKVARAPRSNIGVAANAANSSRPLPAADMMHRAPGRPQLPVGPGNRKRPAQSRPSSPPVAQSVGQRPQKMARIARRMNPVPPVGTIPAKDEVSTPSEAHHARENGSIEGARSNTGMSAAGLVRKVANATATSSANKPKVDRVTSSTGLSESEDSEAGDTKSKEKWRKQGEFEGRFGVVTQKMAPLAISSKKSRVGLKEESGDGVRRQGRSNRSAIAVARETATITHIEKVDANIVAKQLRSGRPGIEKLEKPMEIKPGRPPSKKASGDRKSLTRPRRPPVNGVGDTLGDSGDDHEELAAAVQAAVDASAARCTNGFWKDMEPYFLYLIPEEVESLKRQARELEEAELSFNILRADDKSDKSDTVLATSPGSSVVSVEGRLTRSGNGSMDVDGATVSKIFNKLKGLDRKELHGSWSDKGLPLSQRLLAALIIEVDSDDGSREDGSQTGWQGYNTVDGSFPDLSDSEQADVEKKDQDSEPEVEMKREGRRKLNGWVKSPSYDILHNCNGARPWDSESEILNSPTKSELRKDDEKQHPNLNGVNNCDSQYQSLKLDERIALELQSAGLYPDLSEETAQEDDEVNEELQKSCLELKDQIHVNKGRLCFLEKTVLNRRTEDERELERMAMSKLVESAFNKRLGSRGGSSGSSGSKNSASKAARAAALMFAKRTLTRWRHYVEMGESSFTDAGLRDSLFYFSSKDAKVRAFDNCRTVRGNSFVGLHSMTSLELKPSASEGTGQLCHPSRPEKADRESSESGQMTINFEAVGERDDTCSFKPREIPLDAVVGSANLGNSILAGTKGKRSERERDCKSQSKELIGRNDTGKGTKGTRQGLGTIKGERKNKTKPRQKTAPLLKAVNGLLGKPSEGTTFSLEKPGLTKAKDEPLLLDLVGESAHAEGDGTLDLTHLQIPSMDDLGGQNQDLGSWLDFEDPGLPDAGVDLMGLDVPMDDLAEIL